MAEYVSIRSNWLCVNSKSLDLVSDVCFEESQQSRTADKQQEATNESTLREDTSSNEDVTSVVLRSNQTDKREDPIIMLSVLQPNECSIVSIQFLSNAKHIEFYHREYIGSCHGSRITELDNEPIYESNYDFNPCLEEITLKCLRLADATQLIVYCIQINLTKITANKPSVNAMNLPFDLNRVRSMINETNLSPNARQFMNDLQGLEEKRRTKEPSISQLNLTQMMLTMQGMCKPSSIAAHSSPTQATPTLKQISHINEEVKNRNHEKDDHAVKQNLVNLENRLQAHMDQQFLQLRQHIDNRLDEIEKKLIRLIEPET